MCSPGKNGELWRKLAADAQLIVLWQLSHVRVVEKWSIGWPDTTTPSWQDAHAAVVTMLWSNVAGSHARIRWQVSHEAVVGMCFAACLGALAPL